MKTEVCLRYGATPITVEGDYYPGAPETRHGPTDPAEFSVERVWVSDDPHRHDIAEMLSESMLDWIAEHAIMQLEGDGA